MPEPPTAGSPVRRLLGSFFGAGYLPGAPGTWGSLATVLVVVLLLGVQGLGSGVLGHGLLFAGGAEQASRPDTSATLAVVLTALAVVTLLGVWVGNHAHADWGRGDPGPFVLDEVAGQLIALLPLLPGPLDPLGVGVAFGLFRLLDVTKPPPIGRLERLPKGVGIMADDLAAGLAAMVIVMLVF